MIDERSRKENHPRRNSVVIVLSDGAMAIRLGSNTASRSTTLFLLVPMAPPLLGITTEPAGHVADLAPGLDVHNLLVLIRSSLPGRFISETLSNKKPPSWPVFSSPSGSVPPENRVQRSPKVEIEKSELLGSSFGHLENC